MQPSNKQKEFNEVFADLIADFDFPAYAEKMKVKALNSGCIDLENWDSQNDGMILPKALLNAIFQNCVFQTTPFSKEGRKEADNIYRFI